MTDTNKSKGVSGAKPNTSTNTSISASGDFRVFTPFQGSDSNAFASPLLVPPRAATGGPIQVQVQQVCQVLPAGIPAKTSTPLPTAIDNADFTLVWSGSITKKDLAARDLNVTLTIKDANAWKADPATQSALRANFDDFCRQRSGWSSKTAC